MSPALYAAPFYTCAQNYYVAPTGSDSNAGTALSPWLTIQHADTGAGGRVAGDCVNVAPGTYAAGANITRGGSTAAASGYVVYRCAQLDACHVTDPNSGFNIVSTGGGPNYVVFDGFDLAASKQTAYGQGVEVWDADEGSSTAPPSSHHIWVLNNLIHGYGQSGVQMNDGEYFYVIHNAVYNNSNVTCDAQGSGISFAVLKAFPGYKRTALDNTYGSFNNVVEFNSVYNNMLTKCGTASDQYDTDGNGIIMDTFNNAGSTNVSYPGSTLVSFNIAYGNGAKGIQVFRTNNVTVANNTSYNNELDPYDNATYRPEIANSGGQNNVYLNNIAYAIPGAGILADNAAFGGGDAADVTDANNSWTGNVSFGGTPPYGGGPSGNTFFNADTFSCTANKCNVNPKFIDPVHANFALLSGSPAIGFGKTQSFLPAQAIDAGVCYRTLESCPNPGALGLSVSVAGSGTVTSAPSAISCPGTCSANIQPGTTVTLTPKAGTGAKFSGWGGACAGTGTCAVTMTGLQSVAANFVQPLALSVSETGSGTVTSSPAGISCPGTCSASYNSGTQVKLTATPAAGNSFSGWSGGGCSGTGACSVSMTAAQNVMASFTQTKPPVRLSLTITGKGTTTSSPAGISCPGTCSASFPAGSTVTLTEKPNATWVFTGWSGACGGTGACAVKMNGAQGVTASFVP